MAKNNGTEVVQVDIEAAGGVHMVTWVEAILRPIKGMKLTCGKDPRVWTVHEAYTRTTIRMEGVGNWKQEAV